MLKKLLIATLSCLKKTCVAAATFAVKCGKFLVNLVKSAGNTITEGCNWLTTNLRKPSAISVESEKPSGFMHTIGRTLKVLLMQRFFMFLGGLICIFVLPSDMTQGDLTWFENMLNVWKNTARNMTDSLRWRVEMWVSSLFNRKAVT